MEARALSACGTLSSWNLFEVIETGAKHLIGYAPNFKFDVITDEIVHILFDRKSKSGSASNKGVCEFYGRSMMLFNFCAVRDNAGPIRRS